MIILNEGMKEACMPRSAWQAQRMGRTSLFFLNGVAGAVTVTACLGGIARAQTFSNPAAITIPAFGTATPYPSAISVSGVGGTVSNITATLTGFSHTFPDDVDVLLVGPQGQNVALMFGAGDGTAANNLTFTFSDAAAGAIPNTGALSSGTYRPANYYPADVLSPPAPSAPYGTALSTFNGTDPNGTWRLYVQDKSPSNAGSISGGWSLTVTAVAAPEPSAAALAAVCLPALLLRKRRSVSR